MRLKVRGLLYIFIGLIWLAFSIAVTAQLSMKYLNDEAIDNNVWYMFGGILFMFAVCMIILAPILIMINDYATREVRGDL